MKKEVKDKKIPILKLIAKSIALTFKSSPTLFILESIIGIALGGLFALGTFVSQHVFDSVADAFGGDGSFWNIASLVLVLGFVLISQEVFNGLFNFLGSIYYNKGIGYGGKKVNNKAGKIDPINFEDTSVLDDINKANEGIDTTFGVYMVVIGSFTMYLPYFLFMGIYLYTLKPILVLSLMFIFIPVILTQFLKTKIFVKLEDESAPVRREFEYYEKCIVDREYYKETRLLGAFGYFKELYLFSIKLLNKKIWVAEKKSRIMELSMKFITLLGYLGVLFLLFDGLIKRDISIGAFGAIFASIGMMFEIAQEFICRHFGELTQRIGTVNNLFRFLEMPERHGKEVEIKDVPQVSIDNISFSYPGAKESSLNNVSLDIKQGETIAIVGENGAGKTTLVKLLMGLYLPSKGKVMINQYDTSKISMKSLYKGISAVFQKYEKYKMTLGENINISSFENNLNNPETIKKSLDEALTKADFKMDKENFKDGYDTMLSREFDGIDLSGGQWQRIAIARGFYKAHNMIVLDEPTAAIDPVEESRIYNKFTEMSKGKTSIIVTHRLGSAKIADRIVVMDKGQIVEIGTHEELIDANGQYAAMYNSQSKWYISETPNLRFG